MELRPYQNRAVSAVEAAFGEVRSALIVMATGTGKTIVMSALADRELRRGGRVLILAHRGELLEQAKDKLMKATGIDAGIEKADLTSDTDSETPPYMVVVGSVQSMCRPARLKRFAHDDFSLVMIDECHHALADTYRTVIDHFPNAKLLGVTATPDRGDLRSLGSVFEKIAYEYSIVDAIKDGYLCPIRAQTVPLKIDITGVAKQNGDYQASGLGDALAPYLRQICREIKERCHDRKTIIFTPLIATSQKILEIFGEEGFSNVKEVNGESKDRKAVLDWFASSPKGCVLLNSMLLTEGYDEPSADCIVVLRATKSRSLFVQMVGRGTRLCGGKDNLLLIDFLWMTQTHDLCRPACLLSADDEVCETITRKQESPEGMDALDLTPEALDEAVSETVKKREEALAKKLEAQRRKKGNLVDPLQYAYSIEDINLTNYQPLTDRDAARPTMEQIDRLEAMGFGCPDTFGAAELLIKTGEDRHERGMAAPKEIRLLERRHFKNVAQWTHEQASKMIRRMVVNGWRVPYGINPETYIPQ
jgi:superfamily II DNA or RNA helicase